MVAHVDVFRKNKNTKLMKNCLYSGPGHCVHLSVKGLIKPVLITADGTVITSNKLASMTCHSMVSVKLVRSFSFNLAMYLIMLPLNRNLNHVNSNLSKLMKNKFS